MNRAVLTLCVASLLCGSCEIHACGDAPPRATSGPVIDASPVTPRPLLQRAQDTKWRLPSASSLAEERRINAELQQELPRRTRVRLQNELSAVQTGSYRVKFAPDALVVKWGDEVVETYHYEFVAEHEATLVLRVWTDHSPKKEEATFVFHEGGAVSPLLETRFGNGALDAEGIW
jgi:hypothetical protein